MIKITNQNDVSAAFAKFQPAPDGASPTCRVFAGQWESANLQEWAERGTIDGGPAFPIPGIIGTDGNFIELPVQGMSLRDLFAAAALQGILAKPELYGPSHAKAAGYAFSQADAMLAARERKEDA